MLFRVALNRTIYWNIWKFSFWGVSKNVNSSLNFSTESAKELTLYDLLFLIAIYSPSNYSKHPSELRNEQQKQLLYCNRSFSRLGTQFDDRPKKLTYRQIFPNIFSLTNCPKKITVSQAVSQAVGQADLHTPDMNSVTWLQQLLRTAMLWHFFLLYLLLLKVIP